MRVITGVARGRKLNTLEGLDVRPTAERVKEGVFSALQFDIEGRRVLDLFAGSGQLGIEALSRGAAAATFVDSAPRSISVIKQNLQSTGLEANSVVISGDSIAYLRGRHEPFDIAFLDPPYGKGLLQQALEQICDSMSEYGIIVCEHPTGEQLPEAVGRFTAKKNYRYGKVAVTIYRRQI